MFSCIRGYSFGFFVDLCVVGAAFVDTAAIQVGASRIGLSCNNGVTTGFRVQPGMTNKGKRFAPETSEGLHPGASRSA
jgi:hypothetical protein